MDFLNTIVEGMQFSVIQNLKDNIEIVGKCMKNILNIFKILVPNNK